MGCVVLFCGIPGSGKSTIITHLLKNDKYVSTLGELYGEESCHSEIERKSLNILGDSAKLWELIYVSYDDMCPLSQQQSLVNIPNGWKDYRNDFIDAVEHYLCFLSHLNTESPSISPRSKSMFDSLKSKYNFDVGSRNRMVLFVEDNFYYSSMRYKWFQVSRKYELGFCQVYLDCPVEVALQRNSKRQNKVPENVIQSMSEKAELPDPSRNLWEKYSIVYDSTDKHGIVPLKKIVQLITDAMENPPEPILDVSEQKKEAQMKCSLNVIHQTDKILRRLTGKIIKQLLTEMGSKDDRKILSAKIIQARQKLLRELSEGTVSLPSSISEAVNSHKIENQDSEAEKHLYVILQNEIDKILRNPKMTM